MHKRLSIASTHKFPSKIGESKTLRRTNSPPKLENRRCPGYGCARGHGRNFRFSAIGKRKNQKSVCESVVREARCATKVQKLCQKACPRPSSGKRKLYGARCPPMSSIKRDVKKKVLPRPEARFLFSRSSPLKFRFSGEAWSITHAHKFPPRRVRCYRDRESGKPDCGSRSTMVLSEARGLWLFLVIRGGITCNG